MLARSTSTSTGTSELRYCLDYSSQHVFAARLELEVHVYQSIISELTRCTMNFRSISRIISTPQKIRGTECLSSPAPKAHEAMKQLFAFFKDSEKGMSTDGMKRSIAKSFIDTGTGCDDDGEFQKFYYKREKSEVKLELRLHKPSAICYNLLSYLICLDGDGESFDEVLDDEEDDDDDHEERDEPEEDDDVDESED